MITGAVLIALLVLAGCAVASDDPGQWRHATRTPDDFRRDYAACIEIAARNRARRARRPEGKVQACLTGTTTCGVASRSGLAGSTSAADS